MAMRKALFRFRCWICPGTYHPIPSLPMNRLCCSGRSADGVEPPADDPVHDGNVYDRDRSIEDPRFPPHLLLGLVWYRTALRFLGLESEQRQPTDGLPHTNLHGMGNDGESLSLALIVRGSIQSIWSRVDADAWILGNHASCLLDHPRVSLLVCQQGSTRPRA